MVVLSIETAKKPCNENNNPLDCSLAILLPVDNGLLFPNIFIHLNAESNYIKYVSWKFKESLQFHAKKTYL